MYRDKNHITRQNYCILAYLLKNPIRSKIFNFNKFLSNLDVKDFLQDNNNLSSKWVGSGFVDKDHRHWGPAESW